MENNLILPYSQSIVIWRTSFLSLVPIIYSIYCNKLQLLFISSVVMFTSLNYWRYPLVNSYRRYIDIFFANSCLGYDLYFIYITKRYFTYLFVFLGILCYILSRNIRNTIYNISINDIWISTLLHCGIHIFGNIGHIYLYW